MTIVFDVFKNTPKVDGRLSKVFKISRIDSRYNLVINGKVVGGVNIVFWEKTNVAQLFCLEIYKPFQRKGYGLLLLNKVEELLISKSKGTKAAISLHVAGNNKPAVMLYKKFGLVFEDYSLAEYERIQGYKSLSLNVRLKWDITMRKVVNL
jgi:ribosomal protein S18 acetylase RimI-like enzyme